MHVVYRISSIFCAIALYVPVFDYLLGHAWIVPRIMAIVCAPKREDFSTPETGRLKTFRGHRPTATSLIPYETVTFTPSERTDVLS